jgi:hypothetical protein
MSVSVRVWSIVIVGSGLGVWPGGAARAADPASFEEAAKDAATAPELDALVAPYLDDCSKARREIDRARCRGMRSFVNDSLPNRTYATVVDSPNVVSVSPYDAAIKGYRLKLVGCLTCEKPLAGPGGQKRFVTLKVPDRHAASFGTASKLADTTVSFDTVPEARAWEAKVRPHLRAEFVFKPTAKEWTYREHKGVAFVPVASRIFDRCTGEVLFSSPRSTAKVPVEEDVEGCAPAAPVAAAAAGRGGKDGAAVEGDGGRNKENLDGRPEKLGASEITQALRPVNAGVRACDTKFRTPGSVDLEFEVPGQGGTAQAVRAKGQLGGTEVAQCILEAVRKAKFPEFQRASQTFSFSVRLQGQ